jgi:hypothetical protein
LGRTATVHAADRTPKDCGKLTGIAGSFRVCGAFHGVGVQGVHFM